MPFPKKAEMEVLCDEMTAAIDAYQKASCTWSIDEEGRKRQEKAGSALVDAKQTIKTKHLTHFYKTTALEKLVSRIEKIYPSTTLEPLATAKYKEALSKEKKEDSPAVTTNLIRCLCESTHSKVCSQPRCMKRASYAFAQKKGSDSIQEQCKFNPSSSSNSI